MNFVNGTLFWQNFKNWPGQDLDNYIFKGTSRPLFLNSPPCKCHLNFHELRANVTLYHVTFRMIVHEPYLRNTIS